MYAEALRWADTPTKKLCLTPEVFPFAETKPKQNWPDVLKSVKNDEYFVGIMDRTN
jgi:hypothetical protein